MNGSALATCISIIETFGVTSTMVLALAYILKNVIVTIIVTLPFHRIKNIQNN